MFNKFKTTLKRLADISVTDFFNLLNWSDSSIDGSNPTLLVASAADEKGPAAYTTLEQTFIVNGYAFRPQLSDEAAGSAGDSIYSTIEREAKARGVGKVLIVLPAEVPAQRDEKYLRVIELKLPQTTSVTCRDEQSVRGVAHVTLPN